MNEIKPYKVIDEYVDRIVACGDSYANSNGRSGGSVVRTRRDPLAQAKPQAERAGRSFATTYTYTAGGYGTGSSTMLLSAVSQVQERSISR